MLRSDPQVALDAIVQTSMDAADLYREAAELAAEDSALARLFARLAGRREKLAAELAAHLRGLGDLPSAPDRDRETVEELIAWVKAAWAEDKRLELLEERERAERELAGLVTAALAYDYPAATRAALVAAQEEIAMAEEKLRAAAEEIRTGHGPA